MVGTKLQFHSSKRLGVRAFQRFGKILFSNMDIDIYTAPATLGLLKTKLNLFS